MSVGLVGRAVSITLFVSQSVMDLHSVPVGGGNAPFGCQPPFKNHIIIIIIIIRWVQGEGY